LSLSNTRNDARATAAQLAGELYIPSNGGAALLVGDALGVCLNINTGHFFCAF
jgi:hypothetical protein